MTSSRFFLSKLNYDARSTTHHIYKFICCKREIFFISRSVTAQVSKTQGEETSGYEVSVWVTSYDY